MNTHVPPLTPPPDPNPKTPRLVCPPGAVDCHIHLFGPADRYPFDPGSKYTSADALPETHIAMQDKFGLSMAVVVSGGGYGPNTRHLTDVLERFPDRFRGVALLPSDVTTEEIARLDRLGVRGARFVSPNHGGHMPRLSADMAARIADFGWHVQFYPHGTELVDYADELLKMPGTIVLDHFACIPAEGGTEQPAFRKLLEILDTGRVWVKLSGPMRCSRQEPPYSNVTPMARALVRHSPERLVWGSDWPHVNMTGRTMPNDGDLIDMLLDWVEDEDVRNRILVDNPAELYGLNRKS
ncbi:amidohydrolase family protein [Agaricicola taiwanensis]|nr:amidohydrolase family protein [Agaricicola taiwanensis]